MIYLTLDYCDISIKLLSDKIWMYFCVRPFLPIVVTGSIHDEMQQVISGEALVLLCTTWVVLLSDGENYQRAECHNFFFKYKKWTPRVFVRNYLLLSLNIDLSTQCQCYNTSVLGEKLSWLNAWLISPPLQTECRKGHSNEWPLRHFSC